MAHENPASTKPSSHSHGELTGAWELLSPGEKQNKTPENRAEGERAVRACVALLPAARGSRSLTQLQGLLPLAGLRQPPHIPSFQKCQKPAPSAAPCCPEIRCEHGDGRDTAEPLWRRMRKAQPPAPRAIGTSGCSRACTPRAVRTWFSMEIKFSPKHRAFSMQVTAGRLPR